MKEKNFIAPDAKVLVVDDIRINLEIAEGLMSPYKMQITVCSSGKEAIDLINKNRYDLVLMDHMMPEMDGIEATAKIRAIPCNVPIIAYTANAVLNNKEIVLKNGFNDILQKPVDTMILNNILEEWIPKEKKKPSAEETMQDTGNIDISFAGLDIKKGISMTGGSKKGYLKIISLFYKDSFERINEINKSLEDGNLSLYTVHVHALKSTAAVIGAQKLSEEAKALENAGKQNDTDYINKNNEKFINELEALMKNINKFISSELEDNKNSLIDKELLKTELSRLKDALKRFDFTVINESSENLQVFTGAAVIGDSVSEIIKNKLIGEYDKAVTIIDSLLKEIE